ncbi:MAG TPA: CHAD domain-containing protein [Buttiauxella sp.]|uniref:CHAD domain-containing protein n=1 Tax=Buttiauxella sp. TaxID=1972222 RepID=UPI002B49E378|nr:CHAD domain-containing protein [Buttiauxella sp.]HKM97188.1 CHAD domain-containing protein [Buttiauxella sp.]
MTKKHTTHTESSSQELSAHFSALTLMASRALPLVIARNDIEALHDLRVNLRSLRVLQGLFPHSDLINTQRKQLGVAIKLTGFVRDMEVALTQAESMHANTHTGEAIVVWLAKRLASSRKSLSVRLQTIQIQETLLQASLSWGEKISRERHHVLQSTARKHDRKLEKQLLNAADHVHLNSPITDWHILRLKTKHLRYWREGFAHLLTKPQCRRLPVLVKLQQQLGLLHDVSLFEALFSQEHVLPSSWHIKLKKQQENTLKQAANTLRHLKKS